MLWLTSGCAGRFGDAKREGDKMRKSRRRKWRPKAPRKRGPMGNPMVKDFLAGTFGKILDIVLTGAGVFLLIDGLIFGAVGKIIGGILCLAAGFGIMYALGRIVRFRR
jgi:hypothetical protein